MTVSVLRIEAVAYGEPRSGGWCDHYLLTSMIDQTFALVVGMDVLGWLTGRTCDDCGRVET